MNDILITALAVVVGVLSVGRLARLITQDSFPPSVWLRIKWDEITNDGPWAMLAHCHWCITPWITIPIGLWGWLSDLHASWWVFNAWLAIAYVAAMVVDRDEAE